MIITISQTASNIKQTYEISSSGFWYSGSAGSVSRMQSITLSNNEDTIKGVYNIPKWNNCIPLSYLFGKANLIRFFQLYKNGSPYGNIVFSRHGFLKSYYVITTDSGEILRCYRLSRGSYDRVSIYHGETQIALLETHLSTYDHKYTHKLYLLDDYRQSADILSFFAVYYASHTFARRMHMDAGRTVLIQWSFSGYKDKYDPKWLETHFSDTIFPGKTSL